MSFEVILASGSPRRREILERIGVPFRVYPATVEEVAMVERSPEEMVAGNARLKSEAVAAIFPANVVLGADTSVFLEGRPLNKPRNRDEAMFMLGQLSGRRHTVLTAVSLLRTEEGREWSGVVRSEVTFKPLDWDTVRAYVERVNPLDKAGAYGIQEYGEMLVASYTGSFTNIMGLPLEETAEALAGFGIAVPGRDG